MSEFSESYHIRTANAKATIDQLRAAKLSGFVFPPQNGWLTFVPFANNTVWRKSPGVMSLSAACGSAVVLRHFYAEDHGWAFELYRCGKPVMAYECWWEPEPLHNVSKLDISALTAMISDPSAFKKLTEILSPDAASTPQTRETSHCFAEIIGLPAYRWISPQYAQNDPDSFRTFGGKMIGRLPAKVEEIIQPPPRRTITLPRPDLSAREAFQIADAIVSKWDANWFPIFIAAEGSTLAFSGRLEEHPNNSWCVFYRNDKFEVSLKVNIRSKGEVTTSVNEFAGASIVTRLPTHWIDSPNVAVMLANEPETTSQGSERFKILMMRLQLVEGHPVWEANWQWLPKDWGTDDYVVKSYAIDAENGAIIGEHYIRSRAGKTLEEWHRSR